MRISSEMPLTLCLGLVLHLRNTSVVGLLDDDLPQFQSDVSSTLFMVATISVVSNNFFSQLCKLKMPKRIMFLAVIFKSLIFLYVSDIMHRKIWMPLTCLQEYLCFKLETWLEISPEYQMCFGVRFGLAVAFLLGAMYVNVYVEEQSIVNETPTPEPSPNATPASGSQTFIPASLNDSQSSQRSEDDQASGSVSARSGSGSSIDGGQLGDSGNNSSNSGFTYPDADYSKQRNRRKRLRQIEERASHQSFGVFMNNPTREESTC